MKTSVFTEFKAVLLVAAAMLLTITISAQIPNWDMESWNTKTFETPQQWGYFGATSKVTPAAHGQYAVKIQGDAERGPGALLYGIPDNNLYAGGTPFSARADSMVFYAKYDISAGDSAWVLMIMRKNGVVIGADMYYYTGSYTNAFKRMAYKIHYQTSEIPDTLFIGFTSCNPDNPNGFDINSWAIIDNISFVGTTQNVPNPDFETWTSTTSNIILGWLYEERSIGNPLERTSDKYSGNFAMKLRTIINSGDTAAGYTRTVRAPGEYDWGPSFAVTGKPSSVKGFYKFAPQNGDTFRVHASMFKTGQQIGSGDYHSGAAINTYTPFSCDIFYFQPGVDPDSATIEITTYMADYDTRPRGQSVAYIDNLSFDQFVYAGIGDIRIHRPALLIFPNPTTDITTLQLNALYDDDISINIMDLCGKTIKTIAITKVRTGMNEFKFTAADLPAGICLVHITGNHTSISKPILIR